MEEIRDGLYMYARALETTQEDAEDLVSDTVLACYEKFENIRDYAGFKGYVFKTARSIFRQKYRRSWLFGKFDDLKSQNLTSNDFPSDLPLEIGILYNALDKLPEKQKEAVILFEISGFSINEIRDIQGGTISGVKTRIKRAKEKLTEILVHKDKSYINEKMNGVFRVNNQVEL